MQILKINFSLHLTFYKIHKTLSLQKMSQKILSINKNLYHLVNVYPRVSKKKVSAPKNVTNGQNAQKNEPPPHK